MMIDSGDEEFRDAFKKWAVSLDFYQYQIFVETAKMVDLMKQKKVSAKTKNEILILVKGLQATVKSVSKVLAKYIE